MSKSTLHKSTAEQLQSGDRQKPIKKAGEQSWSDDLQLWDSFKRGDEEAFITIYRQYFQGLFEYGCQFTANESLVEDVLQDLFIELRKNRSKIVINKSIRNYLFTYVRRKTLRYRKKYYDSINSIREVGFTEFEVGISQEQHMIDAQVNKENHDRLQAAIGKLNTRQREIIYYFYYQGMSYAEIKDIMGFTNIRSVRNLVYKALNSMKSSLGIYLYMTLLWQARGV